MYGRVCGQRGATRVSRMVTQVGGVGGQRGVGLSTTFICRVFSSRYGGQRGGRTIRPRSVPGVHGGVDQRYVGGSRGNEYKQIPIRTLFWVGDRDSNQTGTFYGRRNYSYVYRIFAIGRGRGYARQTYGVVRGVTRGT